MASQTTGGAHDSPRDAGERRGPLPETLPPPTYTPAVLALGLILLLWGLLTSWILTVVGLGLMVLALVGWIGDWLDEHERNARPTSNR